MEQSKTKQCPKCKSEIDASATKCPKCTADLRNFFAKHPIWSVIGIFFIVGIVVSGLNGDSSAMQGGTITAPPGVQQNNTPEPPVLKVTADQIFSDYTANEVAADAKYKSKMIEVSGIVGTIGKDIVDSPYVTLKAGGEYSISSVQCMFTKNDEAVLATVVKGKTISLIGKVSGKLGNILLQDCRMR